MYLQQSSIYAESQLIGLQSLIISHDSRFDITPTARVNSPAAGSMLLNRITILNGGIFYQRSNQPASLAVNLTEELTISAGALMDVTQIDLRAHNIFIDISGVLRARGRGYASGKGSSPGIRASHSASGAGHGGAGGQGWNQSIVGRAYGSFERPMQFGSGGGQGYQDLVRSIAFYVCHFVLIAVQIWSWFTHFPFIADILQCT